MIGLLALIANFAMLIAPYDPTETLVGRPRTKPCVNIEIIGATCEGDAYTFGTDLNGRDLFSRVIWGARISIPIGLIAVMISIFFGTIIGLIAGFYGGWIDNIIMRVMDVLLAFPGLLLAIAIVTVLGPGLQNALIAIAIVATPSYARLMRASVLTLKEQEFILAERALGASNRRIMFSQILPNALTPIVVQGTLGIGTAVLDAAALSFLGLGAQPPAPEWGQMLGESFNFFRAKTSSVEGSYDSSHRGPCYVVNRNIIFFQCFQYTYMCQAFSRPSTKNQTHFLGLHRKSAQTKDNNNGKLHLESITHKKSRTFVLL